MTEFELKFEVPPNSFTRVAGAMQQGQVVRQRLQARYFDTPDGALAKSGMVVRLRKEGKRWVQTAKGPTADLLARLEHNAVISPQPRGVVPTPDLSRHRGTPVGRAIDKVLGLKARAGYPSLELLYETDIKRVTTLVVANGSVVEMAFDRGRVFSSAATQTICELEVELKEGLPVDAVTLARQWRSAHGLWLSTIAKSMKGQRLGQVLPSATVTPAAPAEYAHDASEHEVCSAVVASCLSQILPNMSELAGGSQHHDHIHQLRVGLRRLRTALQELGKLFDTSCAIGPQGAVALVSVFRALGAHRDQGNLERVLQPQLLAAGGPAVQWGQTDGALPEKVDVGEVVRAEDFQDALLEMVGFLYREVPPTAKTADNPKKLVAKRLAKLYMQALKDGKNFLELDEAHQHGVRKSLKRLRYLIEFAKPLFGARKVNRMTAALKPVQDALGLYNDELMALHAWRALAADDAQAWFGIGWLTARKQSNAKRCSKLLKGLAKVKPFWRD